MVCGCVWAGVGVDLVGCGWVWVDVGVGGWVSNSALASCRAAVTVRIPPSLNEPPIRVLRVPNGGVAARFLRKHSVFDVSIP